MSSASCRAIQSSTKPACPGRAGQASAPASRPGSTTRKSACGRGAGAVTRCSQPRPRVIAMAASRKSRLARRMRLSRLLVRLVNLEPPLSDCLRRAIVGDEYYQRGTETGLLFGWLIEAALRAKYPGLTHRHWRRTSAGCRAWSSSGRWRGAGSTRQGGPVTSMIPADVAVVIERLDPRELAVLDDDHAEPVIAGRLTTTSACSSSTLTRTPNRCWCSWIVRARSAFGVGDTGFWRTCAPIDPKCWRWCTAGDPSRDSRASTWEASVLRRTWKPQDLGGKRCRRCT